MYLKNYDISCLINSFAKSNSLFWYYIKQIMNVFIRAMVRIFSFGERWNVLFNSAIASLNRTFHLSPHENILTIALINIHYLYTIVQCLYSVCLLFHYCKNLFSKKVLRVMEVLNVLGQKYYKFNQATKENRV